MLRLDILAQVVFVCKVIEILVNLGAGGIDCRPVCLGFERPSVVVGLDIARTSAPPVKTNSCYL